MTPLEMVRQFHEAVGAPVADFPVNLPLSVQLLRESLLREEYEEVLDAAAREQVIDLAKELADLVYVTYGWAVAAGIDLDAVLAEVHRSNMSKLGDDGKPLLREDGKVLKGPNYTEPDVAMALWGIPL